MPMIDAFFSDLPAPEHLLAVELSVEVDESRLEPLEHAADLVELDQEITDLARDVVDAAAQGELLGRLAPFGSGLCGDELILRHEIAPLGMEGDQVRDDALDEGERTIGFSQREVFPRHENNLLGAKWRER